MVNVRSLWSVSVTAAFVVVVVVVSTIVFVPSVNNYSLVVHAVSITAVEGIDDTVPDVVDNNNNKNNKIEQYCNIDSNSNTENSCTTSDYSSPPITTTPTTPVSCNPSTYTYHIIGVSGGLQDGFPDHNKLDYYDYNSNNNNDNDTDTVLCIVQAVYIGRALIRGYKSYLDVMENTHRQYIQEPDQPLINPNVIPTGCYEHANEYWIYLVDTRQVLNTLLYEPRFLSISPDTGYINLTDTTVITLTSPLVKDFLSTLLLQRHKHHSNNNINNNNKTVITEIGIPLVTGVWYNKDSHIPSPPIRHIIEDSNNNNNNNNNSTVPKITYVTNFPDSLAKWAQVNDSDRTIMYDSKCHSYTSPHRTPYNNSIEEQLCSNDMYHYAKERERIYWYGIRTAIRTAERNRYNRTSSSSSSSSTTDNDTNNTNDNDTNNTNNNNNPHTYQCQHGTVRFGVTLASSQINFPIKPITVTTILSQLNYSINYDTAVIELSNQEELNLSDTK